MNKLIVGCLVVGLAGVSQGDNRYWNAGGDVSRPWTDPANWDDGTKGVPQPGDLVVVRDRGTPPLVVNDDDAALATHVTFTFSAQKDKTAGDVIWNVSTNVDFQSTFGDWFTSNGGHPGRFIKRGAGDFNCRVLANDGNGAFKPVHWVIERGVFRYPQFSGGVVPKYGGYGGGHLTVSNGATVVIYSNASGSPELTTTWDHVLSYGLITNASPKRAFIGFNSKPEAPSEVYGPIGGIIRFGPGDSVNLYGTNNTFNETRPIGRRGIDPQVIGVMKFEGAPSSLGTEGDINYDYNGPIWRYLGSVPETVTKQMRVKIHSEYMQGLWDAYHPMSVDGGAYGALTLQNYLYADRNVNSMCVQGTNANPCVYKMTQRIYESVDGNRCWCPVHVIKRGSGVWEFPYAYNRVLSGNQPFMIGGFSIEEGTVRADVITDKGHPSSLGMGTDCFGEYVGTYDASKKVDWSISFGTTNALGEAATEGTLEYVGELQGYSSNRKMVLLGDGRISNNGTNTLQMARVSARTVGEKTLTLEGSNDLDNVMSEISDGAGTVSVAKEGCGKWILRGNQTFSGDLRVKGGTLEIQAPTNYFRYYRLTFMAMGTGYDGFVQPWKIAFFDKDGKNLTQNSYLTPPWADYGTGGYGAQDGKNQPVTREFLNIPEPSGNATHGGTRCGWFAPGRPGTYEWKTYQQSASYMWFSTDERAEGYLTSAGINPALDCEWSWFPVVIRLRSDLAPVAAYDIAAGEQTKRNPTAVRFEGSRDGVCWYELDRQTNLTHPGSKKWYSDQTDWAAGNRTAGCGFPVTNNVAVSSLRNFRSVQVAEGATLKTTVGGTKKIDKLTIGADGVGTIDGFQFAESGTVDFTDVPERLKKPLTAHGTFLNDGGTAANFGAWDFTVNGEVDARKAMGYRDGTFTLFPSGSFIMIR